MTRRRLLLAVGVRLSASCLYPSPSFPKEKAALLRDGMTEAEVVAVLGCPAGDYTGGAGRSIRSDDPSGLWLNRGTGFLDVTDNSVYKGWISDGGAVGVVFDPDGRVKYHWWELVDVNGMRPFLDYVRAVVKRFLP